jgi:hypothetical protein
MGIITYTIAVVFGIGVSYVFVRSYLTEDNGLSSELFD